jgi:DNA processing protein
LSNKASYLALWHTNGIGTFRFYKLIEHFTDIDKLYKTAVEQLISLGIPATIAESLQKPDWRRVEQDIEWASQAGQHLLSWQDDQYPKLLKEIPDAPPFLFVKGDANLLNTPQIAIVGSRKPTPSGIEGAKVFANELSAAGLTITSGLALGIDGAAHQSAMDNGGKTIGVLGTGIDKVYPFRHRKLASQILETGGALASAFPLGTTPKAENFPQRNRIISGLSLGTLVVEAAPRSGSLITARLANEQGRDVFAIPGSIYNPQSKGCHILIQQGAKLTQTPQDILEELPITSPHCDSNILAKQPEMKISLDANSQLLLDCVGYEKTSVDQLIERSNLPAHMVSATALRLELKGLIVAMSGGYYKA